MICEVAATISDGDAIVASTVVDPAVVSCSLDGDDPVASREVDTVVVPCRTTERFNIKYRRGREGSDNYHFLTADGSLISINVLDRRVGLLPAAWPVSVAAWPVPQVAAGLET